MLYIYVEVSCVGLEDTCVRCVAMREYWEGCTCTCVGEIGLEGHCVSCVLCYCLIYYSTFRYIVQLKLCILYLVYYCT